MSKYSWKSYVFSISNFLHGKKYPKQKCQRSSIEETLGYRTVSTVLCANSDFKSYEANTQGMKIQIRRLWLVRKRTNQVRFDSFLILGRAMESLPHFGKVFFSDSFWCQNSGMVWKTFMVIKLGSPSSEKNRVLEPFLGTWNYVVKPCRKVCLASQPPPEGCFSCNTTSWRINRTLWEASLNMKNSHF